MKRVLTIFGGLMAATIITLAPAPADADGSNVVLGGYCVVAYMDAGMPMDGSAEFQSTYEGKRFHFVKAEAKAAFDKNPAKYASSIRYEAWCATALAMGKEMASDPNQFLVRDGALFLFSSADAKAMFEKDAAGMTKKADQNWKKHMKK